MLTDYELALYMKNLYELPIARPETPPTAQSAYERESS